MDQLWAVAAIAIVIAFVFFAGGKGAEMTQGAFEGYFRGFRPDPWPHGVQEEDMDHHWGSRAGRDGASDPAGAAGSVAVERAARDAAELAELTAADASLVATRPVRGYRVHSHT